VLKKPTNQLNRKNQEKLTKNTELREKTDQTNLKINRLGPVQFWF
jgi:hypothetical protein